MSTTASHSDIRSDIRSSDIRSDIRFSDIRSDIRFSDIRSDIRSSDIRSDIRSSDIRSILFVFLLSFLIVPFTASAQGQASDGELMIEETYQVDPGENLVVSVEDADVEVETYDGSEAVIEVYLDGRNMDRAREYFEDQNFEVSQDGANIYVKTFPRKKNYNWNQMGSAQILVYVRIPADFNVNVKTDDGDVLIDDVQGEVLITSSDGDISTGGFTGPQVVIRTSDGDIETGTIDADEVKIVTDDGDISLDDVNSGNLSIRTSDGDIVAQYLTGVSSVSTSDGDIAIRSLQGEEVTVRTSDGDIEADVVDSQRAQFTTSDGSIRLSEVSGELTAKTSDGNLEISLADATDINLRAGDGNVYVRAPSDYSAELYMKGERVELSSGFSFDGTLKKNSADGEINGGRYSFEARSNGGRVVLERN